MNSGTNKITIKRVIASFLLFVLMFAAMVVITYFLFTRTSLSVKLMPVVWAIQGFIVYKVINWFASRN